MTKKYYFPDEIWDIIKNCMFASYDYNYDYWKEETSGAVHSQLVTYKDETKLYENYVNDYSFEKTLEISNFTGGDSIQIIIHTGYSEKLLKNLRLKNNNILKEIEYLEFTLNCSVIYKLYIEFYDVLRKFYKMSGMPFYIFKKGYLCCNSHGCLVNIKFKNKKHRKVTLLVDQYKNNDYEDIDICHYHTYQQLYYVKHIVKKHDNEVFLNFYLPTYFLMCSHKLVNIKLHLDFAVVKLHQVDNMIKITKNINDDIYNYGVDFGRCDNPKISFDSPYSDEIIISSVSANMIRSIGGVHCTSDIMFI